MTDLNERFAAMLEGEPTPPFDLDRVVAVGRRTLRRRNTLTAVAGTAGTAAVTAAIVIPIAAADHGASPSGAVTVLASPTPPTKCNVYYVTPPTPHSRRISGNSPAAKTRFAQAIKKLYLYKEHPGASTLHVRRLRSGVTAVSLCPPGVSSQVGKTPAPDPTSTMPPYHYSADPQAIASGFATELTKQVKELGFTIVYTRPFAQESSTLESGHPSYFDGNVDVQMPDGPANIGVQVTHEVTEQVPFDGKCDPPTCTETTLADGSVEQVSHIDAGSGGAEVIAVEIHHPDGLVVEAQESNYGFGPEATKARSSQPLTVDQLTALAQDAAFAF